MKKITTLIASLMLAIFCGTVTASDFAAAMEAAEAKRKEASSIGAEWRDTKKILKKASAAHEKGDVEKAMKLVAQAHEQSKDAIAQHGREDTAWKLRVLQ